jgi:SNF family Na+-dependent transporter
MSSTTNHKSVTPQMILYWVGLIVTLLLFMLKYLFVAGITALGTMTACLVLTFLKKDDQVRKKQQIILYGASIAVIGAILIFNFL